VVFAFEFLFGSGSVRFPFLVEIYVKAIQYACI